MKNYTAKSTIKKQVDSDVEKLLAILLEIKSKLPDISPKYDIIKFLNTKKCIPRVTLDEPDNRTPLDYLEEKFLSMVRYRVSYSKLKEKYNNNSGFDSMLNNLIQKKYLYRIGLDIYRISDNAFHFLSMKPRMYFDNEMKLIKEVDIGFAIVSVYYAYEFDNLSPEFIFKIEFSNFLNYEVFQKFNNYNYVKYNKTYDVYLLGYLPMSHIEFSKNIKVLVLSLVLTKLLDDSNIRYKTIPEDILFKEFYRYLYDIKPNLDENLPFWDSKNVYVKEISPLFQ